MKTKSELRKECREILKELSKNQALLSSKSQEITDQIYSLLLSNKIIHLNLGAYYPLDDEPEITDLFVNKNLGRISFPSFGEDTGMVFKIGQGHELKKKEMFGRSFFVPSEDSEEVVPEILLIPGLAFSRDGARLGRGKGYYDRYLENKNLIKIGICFHEQLVDEVPMEETDVKMDFVITDKLQLKVENRK
ncbi:5-formyltetrahydrofolate cyclo-ligase [Bacteriovorax sp. Seq25_V]|uniref:5-formyltetrahydrofolate cyclo-ligase n=1 Tax=Bacteriovorax sp. Seq25_V TaxID=1201288 RepID=UPI00038A1BB1|nr:5-formyltetrahydrofolate cyclo-ligase [Bacteriovorax sp. Seq25_V]EQC46862.1 5-formyltetrahydrofolate cyclo-ligase [Bacteriovorax sp. Seq25_V]